MSRRILFACAECEAALVWPVDAEPLANPSMLAEHTFVEGCDSEGRSVVQLHPASRWKARLDPSGIVRCPQGHTVGVRALNGQPAAGRLDFLRERVITREMRGRV